MIRTLKEYLNLILMSIDIASLQGSDTWDWWFLY